MGCSALAEWPKTTLDLAEWELRFKQMATPALIG